MKFFKARHNRKKPPLDAEFPCVTFYKDGWNDFGYFTLYYLFLWFDRDNQVELGMVKIVQLLPDGSIAKKTEIPDEFEQLGEEYCSLGQGEKYYDELIAAKLSGEVLYSLQDAIFLPEHAKSFVELDAFETSLLRFSEARKLFETGVDGLQYTKPTRKKSQKHRRLSFTFKHETPGFDAPHVVSLEFGRRSKLPNRIIAFVGKNGTGKTSVMAEMATQISGISEEGVRGFESLPPSFSRTVVVSYSPFGPFKYPPIRTSSYRYCGILDENNQMLDLVALGNRVTDNLSEIFSLGRTETWLESLEMVGLLDAEPILSDLRAKSDPTEIYKLLTHMSSGHFYCAMAVSDVVANLTKESILFFDEPELYLHPNMLSALMRVLDYVLSRKEFNSYGVVATHSPIVIQELQKKNVRIFSRSGNIPNCVSLDFQTFGDNLTNIVTQVFGATLRDKNYMRILDELAERYSFDEINTLFDDELSLNAKTYLVANMTSGGDSTQ